MAESDASISSSSDIFYNELLSPSELFAARSRSHKIPARGQKEFLPDGSARQRERLQHSLEEHWSLISEERVERLGTLVKGEWIPSKNVVVLKSPAGKFWQTMGFSEHGKQLLLPEEALYLMECGSVQVFLHDLPLSVQEGYEMFLSKDTVNLLQYQVFSHLKRLGYVVSRFDRSSVPSHYARRLNLPPEQDGHGRQLKRKRSPPPRLPDGQGGVAGESPEMRGGEPKSQRVDPEDGAAGLSKPEAERMVEDVPDVIPSGVPERTWWVEGGADLPQSPTRPRHHGWDWETITFPDLGARRCQPALAAPDPSLLPGGLSVGVCAVEPWLRRLNLRPERLSRRERERERSRYRRDVNDDREVRHCLSWAEYHELLRRRRGRRDRPEHLWEGKVTPLLQPGQHTTAGDVLDKIGIVGASRLLDGAAGLDDPDGWKISFDVFQPDTVAEFKKSNPGRPYSRLCVCSFEGPVPDLRVLKQLAFQSGDVPVTFAVVDHGDISFYCFKDFQLPTDTSH
ncbi:tRNA-splicing endonuclease subunit Sen54 isoform X2 [Brienomyrus brachyistius]|uniref:tRNA-splicing endonuclease subunit Sen54 isoform X2 n=1 Tax=Brienomyrus brachyistius TaxID=42636 RepID=UPI0020B2A3F2|nr:tRNA-splicing endonuclease subunit Sen54 isoform X2 [Brienomyrus brachyistius]